MGLGRRTPGAGRDGGDGAGGDGAGRPLADRGGATVPAWWRDAKLGIFVHWTPASVPGFAPTNRDIGSLLASGDRNPMAEMPYSEWYENSLRFPGSSAARHHAEHYGTRPYRAFAEDYQAGLTRWDPDGWAQRFRSSGARYVVLVAKHHDGFCLWPSEVPNPNRSDWSTTRDVVGELADAVRRHGMRFGVYYSGGLDWSFCDHPIGAPSDLFAAVPGGDYPAYADAQVRELIDRYRPDVLWGDIAWPGDRRSLADLVAHYRRAVPDGVVNDRFMPSSALSGLLTTRPAAALIDRLAVSMARRDRGIVPPAPPIFDTRSPEYAQIDTIDHRAWESVRGFDRSFGFNRNSRPHHFLTRDELTWSLCDTVAKGGNLLVNVGPRGADAQIPDDQLTRLGWLADFLGSEADAVRGSRPWVWPGGAVGHREVRYFVDRASLVVAIRRPAPEGALDLPGLAATSGVVATALGPGTASASPGSTPLTIAWRDGDDRPVSLVRIEGAIAASRSTAAM